MDNVSRTLGHLQPQGEDIHMDFISKKTETQDFILMLETAKLVPATVGNYIKSLKI